MTLEFILSFTLVCAALFLPGTLILRAFDLKRSTAVVCAPLVSLSLYGITGIVFDKASLFANALNVGSTVLISSLLIYTVCFIVRRSRNKSVSKTIRKAANSTQRKTRRSMIDLIPCVYVAVGIIIYAIVYLSALPTLDNVAETYDNVFHYNLIRSFVESGIWSSLNASVYLDASTAAPAPFMADAGYYPSIWHLMGSFPVSLLGVPVGVASNAVNFAFVACVYPLSMWLFLKKLFGAERFPILLGALVTFAFGAFPWVLLAHWPLFPNLVSMTMVPILCAMFLSATDGAIVRPKRVANIVLFLFGVVAETFCQPNSIFAAMVLLAPYVVCAGSKAVQERFFSRKTTRDSHSKKSLAQRVFIGAVLVALIALFWYVLFRLPFLQPTINYYWAPIMGKTQAIASVLSLSLALNYPQYALGALVVLGAFYIIIKRRELLWVVGSYGFAAIIFVIAAAFDNCWLKHFISGFWYTDPYRVAAMVGMAGIPLAIMGLVALCDLVRWLVAKFMHEDATIVKQQELSGKHVRVQSDTDLNASWSKTAKVASALVVLLACVAIYSLVVPGSERVTMFKHIHNIAGVHTEGGHGVPYEDAERAFVEEAKNLIDEDDVVLNNPYDGSMMAYGLSDLPLYNRSISGYGSEDETADSALLREKLFEFASNEEVQQAIVDTSADYVLVLENDQERMKLFYPTYDRAPWTGFESLDENTPGFELVLADGDMKLYKIVAP
jgi:hypothetical protein